MTEPVKAGRLSMLALRARIILVLAGAVIPAALVIFSFAWQSLQTSQARAIEDIEQDQALLASRMLASRGAGGRLAAMFAATMGFSGDPEAGCARHVAAAAPVLGGYFGIGVARGGKLLCAQAISGGFDPGALVAAMSVAPAISPASASELVEVPAGKGGVFIVSSAASQAPDVRVFIANDPAFYVGILDLFRATPSSAAFLTDNAMRRIAAGTNAGEGLQNLPGLRLADGKDMRVTRGADGLDYFVATQRLVDGFWLVTAQLKSDVYGPAMRQFALLAAAPILVFTAAALAIWLGLSGLVLRWVHRMEEVTRAYARGEAGVRIGALPGAPVEFAVLARNFDALSDAVAQRTRELEAQVTQKQRFIRELHHRVKNNLQIIASLMALQKGALTPGERAVVRFAEDRVNAMSAAYAVSYAETELGQVSVGALVKEVVQRFFHDTGLQDTGSQDTGSQGVAAAPAPEFAISPLAGMLDIDAAITISMLLAEYLPAMIDASAASRVPVAVKVDCSDASLTLSLAGSAARGDPRGALSTRIVNAYVRQLGATLSETAGGGVAIAIPRVPF